MEDDSTSQLRTILKKFDKQLEILKKRKDILISQIKTVIQTEKIKKAKERINTLK